MIWFFLMGMIAGAVGMTMFAGWWIRTHAVVMRVTKEEMDKLADEERGHSGTDMPGD